MKLTVLCVAVLGAALAAPNGHYHQEYNYKSSSKSFRNNELQRSTDDQGYYRKDGDLEGRVKPVVDANSEHSEYVNPNLKNGQYSGYNANSDMSSYGQLHADGGGYGSGAAGSGAAYGSNNYAAEGSYGSNAAYGSTYGASNYGSRSYYGQNIQSLAQGIQTDLQRQLQEQIREHNAYSQQRLDLEELERQVRQNISERFTNDLRTAYGQQSIRNGMSYSIVGGKIQSNANYNEQELDNLRREMENTLLNELRTGYNQRYYQESHHGSSYSYGGTYSTTIRPTSYQPIYPSIPAHITYTTVRPAHIIDGHSGYSTIHTQARFTPIPNPESITSILTRIQSDLDVILNRQLDEVYRQYFSSSQAYQLANTDVVLQRLQNELRSNLTYLIQEQIRNNYGTQMERGGYLYSVGPNGQVSEDSNYSTRDLENLQATVERHLIQKLNETFQSYRTGYERSQRTQAAYVYSTTPRYEVFTTPRYAYNTPRYSYSTPAYYQSTPVYYQSTPNYYASTPNYYASTPVNSGVIHTKGGGNRYGYASGSRYSGYETSGGAASSSSSIAQLQNQFQSELQSELNSALNRYYNTYSGGSGGTNNPQAYQASLQQLSEELNRNVSRHLQEYSASASWSASGDYNQGQVQGMKDQLLANLMRQLEQNLQQHYQSSASSSYSSYSSGGQAYSGGQANYRPVRDNYQMGQYRSGGQVMVGEDCVHDDPNSYRAKRSAYKPYRSSYGGSYRSPSIDQQTEDLDLGQRTLELGQELEETDDLPQQIEEVQLPYQVRDSELGQHTLDDTQQIEDDEFGHIEVGQREIDTGNSDTQLTEVEDLEYGKLKHDTGSTTVRYAGSLGNANVDSTQQVIQPSDLHAHKRTEEVVKDSIENDLSQQLEYTVQKYKQLSQSSRTLSQVYIQEISNQLERNVTQKLREAYEDGSSSYTQSSKPTNDAEFLALKDKIYKELWENFQQKVEQSYQSSTSWQSSTAHQVPSNNRQIYGQPRPVEHLPHSTTSSYLTYSSTPSYLENSQSEQLNKRQIRFVKYAKDKLLIDLREAIRENQRNKLSLNSSKNDRQIVNEVQQNVTDALNSYSEYFLHDYLALSDQQIRNIKNQLTDELRLQAQSQLTNSYDDQEQIEGQIEEESPQLFHSKPQVPSVSWSQEQHQDLNQNSELLGQVIENDDEQHIESEPYQKPAVDSLIKVQEPLQERESQSQLNSNIEQNQLLGQTIEDEDDFQKVDNEFSPLSQTSPSRKPYQYNGPNQNSPDFTGQVIDDEDVQQVETELHPQSQTIDEPVPAQISTGNKQNLGRGIQEGQVVVDYDDVGQIVEDEFVIPPLETLAPPPKPQSSLRYRTTQKPQIELYGPVPSQNLPANQPSSQNTFGFGQSAPSQQNLQGSANQPPTQNTFGYGQSVTSQNSLGSANQPPTQNTFGYGQQVPSQDLQPPVQDTIGYGQQVPIQNWQPSAQNSLSYGQQVDNTQKIEDEFYIPPLSPPPSPPAQYKPYVYGPQQVLAPVPAGGQYGYNQQPNNFYPQPQYPYIPPENQLTLQNTNQNINSLYGTQQRQQFYPMYNPMSLPSPAQYGNSQMRQNTNTFLETEIDHQQNNLQTLNRVTEQQRVNNPTTEINLRDHNDLEDNVEQVPERQPGGAWVGLTDQGQTISQSQSRQEAESTADQLVERLRAHANRNNQGTQGRIVSENPLEPRPSGGIDYRYRPNYNRGDISYVSRVTPVTTSVLPTATSTTSKFNYGVPQSLPEDEQVEEIEPFESAEANVIQSVQPSPNTYSGVKGRRILPAQAQTVASTQASVILPNAIVEVDPVGNIETREETTPIVITDENLPWWKKFGNKVKQGAQNLKQKIVG